MAEFSDTFENAIINLMRNVAFTQTSVFVGLFTAATGLEADSGWAATEVSGGGYARQPVGLSAPVNGVSSNAAIIAFPTATANWGTVTHMALMTAATAGNVLMWSPLDVAQTVNSGNTFQFNAGQLSVNIT